MTVFTQCEAMAMDRDGRVWQCSGLNDIAAEFGWHSGQHTFRPLGALDDRPE